MLEAILRGDSLAIQSLAALDSDHWGALLRSLRRDQEAMPAALVNGLLALDPAEAWQYRAWKAADELLLDYEAIGSDAKPSYLFKRWLRAGVIQHVPEDAPAAVAARLDRLAAREVDDARAEAERLIALTSSSQPAAALRACITLTIIETEAGATEAAISASRRAVAIAGALEEGARERASRQLGAALLRAAQVDEALEVLRGNMSGARMDFTGVAIGPRAPEGSLAAALEEAAEVCINAHDTSAEWLRAIGGVAQRSGEPRHWAAFEAVLAAVKREEDIAHEELEIATQQAEERGLIEVLARLRVARAR